MNLPPTPESYAESTGGSLSAGTRIVKEAGLTVGWNLAGSVLRFISGILIARLYSIEWLGIYAIAHSIARITADVGHLGIDQGMVRYVSRLHTLGQHAQLVAVLRQGVRYALGGGIAVGCLLAWFGKDLGGVLLRAQETQLGWMIAGFAVAIPLMTVAQVLAAAIQGMKDLKRRAMALEVFPALAFCVGLLGLQGQADPQVVLTVGFVASQLVSLLSAIWFLNRCVPIRTHPRIAPEPGLLSYSIPLLLTGVLSNLTRWGDVILLGLFSTAEATGLYQFAVRIAAVMSIVTTSVVGIFAPIVSGFHARKQVEEIRHHLKWVGRWCFSFSWPSLLFLAIYGAQTLLVFGSEFVPAATTLALLAAGHFLWSLVAGNMMLLSMTGYPKLNLFNMAATLIVSVAAGVSLIPALGAVGAALAVLASLAVWTFLQIAQVWKIYRTIPFSSAHWKPLAAGLLAAVVSLPIERVLLDWNPALVLVVAASGFVAVYACALWALGIESSDRKIVTNLVGSAATD